MRPCHECGCLFSGDKRGSQIHCSKYCAKIAANKKSNLKWAARGEKAPRKNSLKHSWSIHPKVYNHVDKFEFEVDYYNA